MYFPATIFADVANLPQGEVMDIIAEYLLYRLFSLLKIIFGLPLHTYYILSGRVRPDKLFGFVVPVALAWTLVALIVWLIWKESHFLRTESDARVFWVLLLGMFPF